MAPSRALVPMRTFAVVCRRPFLQQPLARVSLARGKRTKAAEVHRRKGQSSIEQAFRSEDHQKLFEKYASRIKSLAADDDVLRPMTEEELNAPDLPVINWYEENVDEGTPRRLVKTIATPADRRREQELGMMIEESYNNPDYDDAELNRRLIDNLIADPDMAGLKDSLQEIKNDFKSKEEMDSLADEVEKDLEIEAKQYGANVRAAAYEALQSLIDDPDLEHARRELLEAQEKLPDDEDFNNPEFQAALERAMAMLKDNDVFQSKMAAMAAEPSNIAHEQRMAEIEKGLDEVIAASDDDEEDDLDLDAEPSEELETALRVLVQLRDIFKALGDESGIASEIDGILNENEDVETIEELDFEQGLDTEELVGKLKELVQSKASKALVRNVEAKQMHIPEELRVLIDQLVADPKLPEKLASVRKSILSRQEADVTLIPHETAPDPYDLTPSHTTTLEQQLIVARHSPEHIAAIQRLRVRLSSPYDISPALGLFNEAIELAYIGANDEIRRNLWRAYQKARVLPTFMQNVSDEAWDILYYSQAVKWPSNQNRESHLKAILADLKSLGRDGPPTHPGSLVK